LLQTDASRHAQQLVMLDTENEFFYEYLLQLKQSTNGVKIISIFCDVTFGFVSKAGSPHH
jgi:hypothetical protein